MLCAGFDGSHDELYWNVTGNDWAVPIRRSASTHIVFPPNASGELRGQAFTGQYGSRVQDATVQGTGNSVSVETNGPLSMREGLTADVYITKGVLTPASQLTQALWFLRRRNSIFAAAVVGVPGDVLLLVDRGPRSQARHFGRAHVRKPPKGMTPAEVGTLIDDAVHPRDITATLVDLGVKGYLKDRRDTEYALPSRATAISFFHLLKPQPKETGESLETSTSA